MEEVISRVTERPVSSENARLGDAGMPDVPHTDDAGASPVSTPPARLPSSVHIPPRPSAPPTSGLPQVRPNRKPASGAAQFGKLLSARTAKLRASKPGAGAQDLGRTVWAGAQESGRTLWAGAQRLGLAKVGAALVAVVVLGLVIWWLTALGTAKPQPAAGTSPAPAASSSADAPAARGPLPLEGVNPMDFRLGDCFKDFDANAATSTVVACDTGHSAQLVAIESYAASDAYPGRDPLKQKALDACKAALLTDKSSDYMLSYKLAYPSSSSWGTGDRRVDCYVAADAGNVIMESLLP